MNSAQPKRSSVSQSRWRDQLRSAYTDPATLLQTLGIAVDDSQILKHAPFPMRVPHALAKRMRPGDINDPILKQVLPMNAETIPQPGYLNDPVGDQASRQSRGVLHKYFGRALLITTGACAVHCRYCFRQHFPYAQEHMGGSFSHEAIEYIANTPTINEVILSGGDPLMLSTKRLAELTDRLAKAKHIQRLRIHTRLPIVLPDRITDELMHWLANLPWPVVMVIHANHAQEFDHEVDTALAKLKHAGVCLLNQAVLLKGVNDEAGELANLMERGFAAGVLPYYLHRLDKVTGAGHFEVTDEAMTEIMHDLRARLSGYLVPKLVAEIAGQLYKVPLL